MANTLLRPIFANLPDTSGNVYAEPAALNLQSNDLIPHLVWVFTDTSTRLTVGGTFKVPHNYVGTAKIGIWWATTATSGNARWEFDYVPIADGETSDPSANTESVGSTVAAPGTARLYKATEIALTSANLSADDLVQFVIARDGAEAGPADTIAASLYVPVSGGLYFSYVDA